MISLYWNIVREAGKFMNLQFFLLEESHKKAVHHVHEEAVGLIRRLVLHSECMTEVASLDVIGHMIQLCGIFFDKSLHINCCLSVRQYSPKALTYLHDLSHSKRLVGKVREMSSDASKKIVEECNVKGRLALDVFSILF